MQYCLKYFLCIFLIWNSALSQSPYLSVKAKMFEGGSVKYHIGLKICSVKNSGEYSHVFSGDTSKINFEKLDDSDFLCTNFFDTDNRQPINNFSFSNQLYAYEKILVLRFRDMSSKDWHREMFIVLPIRYESFVTYIELNDIIFKEGQVIYLNSLPDKRNKDKHLVIKESLKNYSSMPYDELPVKLNLEEF